MIIAAKASAVRGTAAFLTRREISTSVATTMNEALNFLSEKKPDIVLVSVNYPHQKIESFPMLLNQSFGVETIAFAESHDRKSGARLQNMRAGHVITGLISGPAVLMKIRQIENALNSTTEDEKYKTGEGSAAAEGPGAIVLKGQRSKKQEEALGDLMRVLSQDGSEGSEDGGAEKSATTDAGSSAPLSASTGAVNPSKGSASTSSTEASAEDAASSGTRSSNMQNMAGSVASGEKNATQQDRPESSAKSPELGAPADPSLQLSVEKRASRLQKQSAAQSPLVEADEAQLFWKYVTRALGTVCPDIPETFEIDKVGAADLLFIQTGQVRGACLIVSAEGGGRRELIDRFQVAFFSLLRAEGIELSAEEQIVITLDEVALVGESFNKSEVKAGGSSMHRFVGAAMVAVTKVQPEIEQAGDQMLKIKLADLPIELPVSYEVYLHMPLNKKFLRYLRAGATLSQDQKDRLEENKIKHLFLNESDAEAYRRQYAARAIRAA